MADAEVIALLAHIRDTGERTEKKLDEHILRDESISKDFVLPLWNESQQRKGARAIAGAAYAVISGVVALAVSAFTQGVHK